MLKWFADLCLSKGTVKWIDCECYKAGIKTLANLARKYRSHIMADFTFGNERVLNGFRRTVTIGATIIAALLTSAICIQTHIIMPSAVTKLD